MTAESTVPFPGAQHQDRGFSSVSVMPPRGAAPGFRYPVRGRPARLASPVPLLLADGVAALPAGLTLLGTPLPALSVSLLVAASLLPRPDGVRPPAGILDELPAVCGRIAVTWLALAALMAAYRPDHALSVHILLAGFAVQAAVGCALRGAVHARRRTALLRHPHTALVIGPAATAQRVAAAVLRHPECGVRPVGVVADRPDGTGSLPVLTTGEEVQRATIQNGVSAVLAVHPSVRTEQGPLLRALAESGYVIWEVDTDTPSYGSRGRLAGFPCRRLRMAAPRHVGVGKRALDILVSGTLLLLISPVLMACAVVLRICDGPGVVFRQERIGKGGKPFTLLKFRTHRPADAHEAATRWSVANEHEMRGFCRMLRRTSLDELLQLWNVLRGDMSLVGPRPERPYFVAQFSRAHPGYAARHRMRTGITGLAQVHGLRGDTSIEDRCRFDNAYIDDWSLWQDVCILLRTAAALVRPTGS
ncbi:exopolysaccharide biosynthesis polyprenyl glycosylphosphotransferase [Streptomyces sp. LBL]|uniref:exopolysaccharide biosynthesis polyprenyl glycosylphosphotransferase n=1 Tax=Streptomyces sp. LBL TaxID=2940562 RepID=UPI00247435ED|nr:exopolysaccharide biosynthesis polyprenyl glycosylphosphotransferase [Streptomyces sp. LBL]MDH6623497.1 exopolysaccharide biosynthesis polyprenyl glycosylphosphotransferase [Streptomyces sp. LBL]